MKHKKFVPGERFFYLGQSYALRAVDDLPKAIVMEETLMISSMVLANARDHLEFWYKERAWEHLSRRVEHFAQMTGLKYKSIGITNASTRWGSCGHKDTLNFTWRLIMAPAQVVDYVVVHELMHIKQKNHSRQFWDEVADVLPGYQQEDQWLKNNAKLLVWR